MTLEDYSRRAATVWNANRDQHFPGRPLFEGLVQTAVREATERAATVARQCCEVYGAEFADAVYKKVLEGVTDELR